MTSGRVESYVLDSAVAQLRAEGLEVYVNPSRQVLPDFLSDWKLDAVAFGKPKNFIIEVSRVDSKPAQERLQRLRSLLAGQKDWHLQVHYVATSDTGEGLTTVPQGTIEETINLIQQLANENQNAPALIMGWATVEALGRALIPNEFVKPQTPGRLVEVLARSGHLTPTEADGLRELAKLRNKLVHGDLQAVVSKANLNEFIKVIRMLFSELASPA